MREEIACPLNPLPFFAKKSNNILSSPLFLFSFDTFLRALLFFFSLFLFFSFLFTTRRRTKKTQGRGEACFFCFDALPGTGIRLQLLKKTRHTHTHTHTAFFNSSNLFWLFETERERKRLAFCLSGEPLIPRFAFRHAHARNYHDFRFFARPPRANDFSFLPSRSLLPPPF